MNGLARIILFHMAVDLRKALLPCVEVLLGFSHDETHADEPDQRSADGGQRHVPFGDEHHHHAPHQRRHRGYQRSDAHVQRLRDHVDVVGDAGQSSYEYYLSEGYPRVWFCTSPSDSLLYAHARRMHEFMLRNGIPHEYREYSSTARKLDHVFNVLHPEYPESIQANEDIVRFFLDFNQRT